MFPVSQTGAKFSPPFSMDRATPRQVMLEGIRKVTEHKPGDQASKHCLTLTLSLKCQSSEKEALCSFRNKTFTHGPESAMSRCQHLLEVYTCAHSLWGWQASLKLPLFRKKGHGKASSWFLKVHLLSARQFNLFFAQPFLCNSEWFSYIFLQTQGSAQEAGGRLCSV